MTRFTVICAVVVVVACSFSLKSIATRIYMQNHCGVTVCGRYWGGVNVGRSCSRLLPGHTWPVPASPNWKSVSMWAIESGGCEPQHCNLGGPDGAFTEFVISVDGSNHYDSYGIFSDPHRYNVAMKAKPTTAGCASVLCSSRPTFNSYFDTKNCPTGTDYYLELCPPY